MKASEFFKRLMFPPRCAVCDDVLGFLTTCPRCRDIADRLMDCPAARSGEGAPEKIAFACAPYWYEEPIVRAVLRAKFYAGQESILLLARAMAYTIKLYGVQAVGLVPVPSHASSVQRRGHDAALLLAQALSGQTGLPVYSDVLVKAVKTAQQHRLSREQRLVNLTGAFMCANSEQLQGKAVLLVDDVMTTGSTLNECAGVLLDAGVRSCMAVCAAFAPMEGRI